jgi:hypothetical protein
VQFVAQDAQQRRGRATMPRAATSLSLTSCDDAVAIYALLLGGAHSSRGNGPETRLKLRIADAIAIDPATKEVQAHYFTSKQGVVMRKNRSSLGLHEVLQSLLDGLVSAAHRCCVCRRQRGCWCAMVFAAPHSRRLPASLPHHPLWVIACDFLRDLLPRLLHARLSCGLL